MARVAGGVAGWLISLLPLLAVNLAAYLGVFTINDAVVLGELTLAGGLLLGGIITGVIGSRPRPSLPGGVTGAFYTGGIAALLYALTLFIAGIVITLLGSTSDFFASQSPIGVIIALVAAALFPAALLAMIAVVTGMIASRMRRAPRPQRASAPARQPQPASRPMAKSVPLSRYGSGPDWNDQPAQRQGQARRTRPLSDYQEGPPNPPRHAPPTQPRYREGQAARPPSPTRPGPGQWQQRDYPPQDDWRR